MAGSPSPAPLPPLPGPPFEVVSARFFTHINGKDRVEVQIKRNLSLTDQVDEIYMDFILRATDDPTNQPGERVPGYFGSAYFRRTQTPTPPELDAPRFAMAGEAFPLTSDALPNGPVQPSQSVPHPIQMLYVRRNAQPPIQGRDCQLVNVVDERAGPLADTERGG